MAKHKMPAVHGGEVNVTPLIDVVMCLIIFFMLVAKIGVNTGAKKMELPETIIGVKIEKLGPNMLLNVTDPNLKVDPATGKVDMAASEAVKSNIKEPLVAAVVDPNSKEAKEIGLTELTRVLTEAKKKNPKFSVTVRAQKEMKFEMLRQVLAAVGRAEISKVNFASMGKTLSSVGAAK
jgi:biopolymer transport protein ExbD